MPFTRPVVQDGGLPRPMRQGDGLMSNLSVFGFGDANTTLAAAQITGGLISFTTLTAGRNITTPTAADLNVAFSNMDIGDSFLLTVSVIPGFALTWVANTGVSLAGRATAPASTCSFVLITKTGSATYTWRGL